MLDMGFTPQIEMILKFVPKDHQTLLFSATLPQNIVRISERYLNKPERISTGSTSVPIAKIKQETLQVFKENKYDELVDQFIARKGSILVFVKTKRGADKMVKRLKEEGHSADAIHGDLRQSKRDRVINSFRKGLKRILIATDVAARGLDIPLIQHVINYDLPQVPEDYVHRIGRTARAGNEGSALTFLTPDDRPMWNEISKLIDPNFKLTPRRARGNSRSGKKGKPPYNKKRKFRDEKRSSYGRPDRSSEMERKKALVTKENLVLVINQNLMAKEGLIDHQEMERKKALVTKENLVLVINQNLMAKEGLIDHQEMERKKALVTKENLVLVINQNLMAKEGLIDHQEMERKKALVTKENLVLVINQNLMAKEGLIDHQEMERKKALVTKENLVLVINQNLMAKEGLIDHQEMERKKALVTKENLVLVINQNLMAKEGLIDHQEMERKKALVTKENLVLPKKITQNPLVLQTILNILEKKHLKIRQPMKKIA